MRGLLEKSSNRDADRHRQDSKQPLHPPGKSRIPASGQLALHRWPDVKQMAFLAGLSLSEGHIRNTIFNLRSAALAEPEGAECESC